jgi:hypothetical protein
LNQVDVDSLTLLKMDIRKRKGADANEFAITKVETP